MAALAIAVSWHVVEGQSFDSRGDVIAQSSGAQTGAPTGFDDQPNGLVEPSIREEDRADFDEVELIPDGLGHIYNAQSRRSATRTPPPVPSVR